MGRGLDGYLISYFEGLVQFSSSTERLAKFRWRIASGRHLFPFRTEQLSHSAPMVLGGQPPGRVGRRRFFVVTLRAAPAGGSLSFPLAYFGALLGTEKKRTVDAVPAAGLRVLDRQDQSWSSEAAGSGCRSSQGLAVTGLAARDRFRGGLEAVLAEGREVDQEVGGIGQPGAYVFA